MTATKPLVPFNRVSIRGGELARIGEALARGHVSGDGPFGRQCEALLASATGAKRVLLTTSCTHALELSALLLDIQPGDEVVVPSFTFVSTINAFVLRGAKPVFCDVRPDTLNLDEKQLPSLLGPRTKAIVPVHYAGVGCAMDEILGAAAGRGIAVVEDNAHGLFGTYKGKPLGSFGVLATQSFHETKNVSCGEGGALLLNDERFVERAEVLREKGTNRSRFFRGQVDKYTWVDVGSSWVISDVLAAILLTQLEEAEAIQRERRRIWERYADALAGWAEAQGVRLPVIPPECEQAFHMFYLLLPDLAQRTAFLAHLAAANVKAVFHYLPLHLSPMGTALGGREGQCPVTERVSDQLVRLPFYVGLDERQEEVIEAVLAFR